MDKIKSHVYMPQCPVKATRNLRTNTKHDIYALISKIHFRVRTQCDSQPITSTYIYVRYTYSPIIYYINGKTCPHT